MCLVALRAVFDLASADSTGYRGTRPVDSSRALPHLLAMQEWSRAEKGEGHPGV